MSVLNVEKHALRVAAARKLDAHGIGFQGGISDPEIVRKHIDGPYLRRLDGQLHWLSLKERLMTRLGLWGAWEVEYRHSPLFAHRTSSKASPL